MKQWLPAILIGFLLGFVPLSIKSLQDNEDSQLWVNGYRTDATKCRREIETEQANLRACREDLKSCDDLFKQADLVARNFVKEHSDCENQLDLCTKKQTEDNQHVK